MGLIIIMQYHTYCGKITIQIFNNMKNVIYLFIYFFENLQFSEELWIRQINGKIT